MAARSELSDDFCCGICLLNAGTCGHCNLGNMCICMYVRPYVCM
jgi:hypothetical protein